MKGKDAKSLEESRKQNLKLDLLTEVYAEIKMNNTTNQEAINNFISWVSEISDCVNSDKIVAVVSIAALCPISTLYFFIAFCFEK